MSEPSTTSMLTSWMRSQKPKSHSMRSHPAFYRNLEEALDVRRRSHALHTIKASSSIENTTVDFSSNDTLSLGASGRLRAEFDAEFARHPDRPIGAGSSRVMDGNYAYLEMVEEEIAAFHAAETGLIVASGFEANMAILTAIPRAGDAIVYDELVHASAHDGMVSSQANYRLAFRHNDVDSFRDVLVAIAEAQPLVKQEKRCVIVVVESFYSMDGDVCPLRELVEVAKEIFPGRNVQFVVDEAHSTGVVGPRGAGLVNELGLEKEIAVRLHTFGKALASSGAIILGNETIKTALVNLARPVIYTTAPAFPVVVAARSAYSLLRSGQTQIAQSHVQHIVCHFFGTLESNTSCEEAMDRGILDVPLSADWEEKPFLTHIVPIWTRQRYSYWLVFHMTLRGFTAFPVEYPTVPRGQSRVRLAFHANNTEEQVERLVDVVAEWAREMIVIEDRNGEKVPRVARMVYASMGEAD